MVIKREVLPCFAVHAHCPLLSSQYFSSGADIPRSSFISTPIFTKAPTHCQSVREVFNRRGNRWYSEVTGDSFHRRGLNPPHRTKSITMTSFTDEEIDFIRNRGNEVSVSHSLVVVLLLRLLLLCGPKLAAILWSLLLAIRWMGGSAARLLNVNENEFSENCRLKHLKA